MKFFITFLVLCPLFLSKSHAQLFRLNITNYNGADANPAVKAYIDSTILEVQNDINKDLPGAKPKRLMEGMANASAFSGKGVGADYASHMEVMLIGAGIGVGADMEKDKETDSDISGIGVQGGLVVGLNLGVMDTQKILGLDTDRLNVYANFFDYNFERSLDDGSIGADMISFGFHVSYDWIKGENSRLFGWGGVKIHTGYEYSKNKYHFKSKIDKTVEEDNGTEVLSGTLTGNPTANINVATQSIPLEISTHVNFLYFLTMYTGLGVDYNMGTAEGDGGLNASPSNINCTGGAVCGGGAGTDIEVTPEANIDGKGKVDPFFARGFLGIQFNLPFTRVFVQADKGLGNDLVGATAGLRFVY